MTYHSHILEVFTIPHGTNITFHKMTNDENKVEETVEQPVAIPDAPESAEMPPESDLEVETDDSSID